MPVSGWGIAYTSAGGILVFSAIRGSSISDTVKAISQGNLSVTDTEPIQSASQPAGSSVNVTSGSTSANYLTIANYLVSNGYSAAAAAGVVACIAGESGGDPEALEDKGTPIESNSGGGGLIQWTPISAHPNYITGNASADLDTQLPAIIAYNNARAGGSLVQMLKVMTNPIQAADFYSQNFEAPAVLDSDVRDNVATSVYNSLTSSATAAASNPGTTSKTSINKPL